MIPTRLKIIQGTSKNSDARRNEPQFTQVNEETFPDPPATLNADGAELWNNFGRECVACGILQVLDLYALQTLAYAWQRYQMRVKAQADITAAELKLIKVLFAEFGATPVARKRVTSTGMGDGTGNGRRTTTANRFAKFKSET